MLIRDSRARDAIYLVDVIIPTRIIEFRLFSEI